MSSALRISIGANIVLAAFVAVLLRHDPAREGSSIAARVRPTWVPSEAPKAGAVTGLPSPKSGESHLTREAIARLQQIGISRDAVITVVLEDINRRSIRQVVKLQKSYAPKSVPDREYRRLSRES